MNLLSCIGSYWKMDKVMLTVFKGIYQTCLFQLVYAKKHL